MPELQRELQETLGANYEQGQIDFERRKDRFIFNYWWNSLKSGIVDAMLSDAGKLFNLDEKAKETVKK